MTKAKKTSEKNDAAMPFEDAVNALETVIEQLEGGELTLDGSLKSFEEGVRLIRCCDGHIKGARGKLLELSQGENGHIVTEILDDGDN